MAMAATRLRINEFVAPGLQALAHGLGYFEAAGLDLEVERTRSATDQRRRVMSNECDAALTAIDNLIAWDAEGDDLRLVAQVERTTVLDLVARPDVGSVAELRGSTLAVDAVDSGFAIVLRWILSATASARRSIACSRKAASRSDSPPSPNDARQQACLDRHGAVTPSTPGCTV